MALDAAARRLLATAYRSSAPRMHELSVLQARHALRKLMHAYRPAPVPVASVADLAMPRPPSAGGPLFARIYRPLRSGFVEALPVLLWFHGGGWMLGDLESYDVLCRDIASRSGVAVVAIDYRLAPEHPFPAAVEDACFAVDWIAAHACELGLDARRLALGGDSAGGNLAAVAALAARDATWPSLRFQLLVYPAVDQLSARGTHTQFGEGYLLDRETIAWFQSHYLPEAVERSDWRVSPLHANWLGGLPPTLLVLAECDSLTDDGLAYADLLREAGVPTEFAVIEGGIHGFLPLGRVFKQSDRALDLIADALRSRLA